MFRRPRFRPVRRLFQGEVPPVLCRAQESMAAGEFEEAAGLFEELAHGAQARELPQDAHLFIQAGHCRIQMRQIDLAMLDLKQGLGIMLARGRVVIFHNAGQRCIEGLTEAGYQSEADEIKRLVASQLSVKTDKNNLHGELPTVCDSCGGSLRPDEVEWIDENTAECPWCGTVIKQKDR